MTKMYRAKKYISIALLLFGISLLSFSCINDKLLDEYEQNDGVFGDDVYSLNFMVTLDNMGASETRAITDGDLHESQNTRITSISSDSAYCSSTVTTSSSSSRKTGG